MFECFENIKKINNIKKTQNKPKKLITLSKSSRFIMYPSSCCSDNGKSKGSNGFSSVGESWPPLKK